MNQTLALKTTQTLFVSIGGVGLIAFAATLQWWLDLIGFTLCVIMWSLIYKLLEGVSSL